MVRVLLVALMASMLNGCIGYVHGDDGYYDRHDNRNGGFCPPGQAKKGNC